MASHYDILGLRSDATPSDIRRAAEAIRRTFQRDEMAVYSLMESEDERQAFLTEIETAARVLLARASREQYDAMMLIEPRYIFTDADMIAPVAVPAAGSGQGEARTMVLPLERPVTVPVSPEVRPSAATAVPGPSAAVVTPDPAAGVDAMSPVDGRVLARLRAQSGLSAEHVIAQLKLSMTQLLALEAMDHHRLPADVYVKGFVKGYARLLRLDPEQTSQEYMAAFKAARSA